MNRLLQEATYSNNEGVSHLKFNRIECAELAFRKGIELAQQVLKEGERNSTTRSSKPSTLLDTVLFDINLQDLPGTLAHSAEKEEGEAAGTGYISHRAVWLDETSGAGAQEVQGNSHYFVSQITAVLLFNLALINHLQGIRRGNSTPFLRAAAGLYDAALFLLVSVASLHHKSWPLALQVLALNNGAQICYEQCDYGVSRQKLDLMTELMCQRELFCLESLVSDQDFDGLLANTLMLNPPFAAHAA